MQLKSWKKKTLLSFLLLPLSLLYSGAGYLRPLITTKYRARIPVICVGNVTVGGAGKTPVVLAITELLRKNNLKVAIASRGYKGEITTPTLVDKIRHTVNSVGDEPLMLARIAPTYIAAHRPLAIQMAEKGGANVIIMDDGMQNPSVRKDLTLLVIDGKYGIGNGFIIPAGPLREELACGVRKADAIILVGHDDTGILKHPSLRKKSTPPIIRAKLQPYGDLPDKTTPYLAFAGIGNPEKFFSSLAVNGYNIKEEISFPDHYNYCDSDLSNLINKAEKSGAGLITTEKDEVRLPLFARKKVKILPIKIVWEDEKQIKDLLEKIIKK